MRAVNIKKHTGKNAHLCRVAAVFFAVMFVFGNIRAQQQPRIHTGKQDLFGNRHVFIENIGQYGERVKEQPAMGRILYGYEALGMPVLFTQKGVVHLQRKIEGGEEREREREERERRERKKEHREKDREKDELEEQEAIDRVITVEWLNASPDVQVIPALPENAYHTYAPVNGKARGFKTITYRSLYPGIDVVYSFNNNDKAGFEYSIIIHPGADVSQVKMKYGGDIKSIKLDAAGKLLIRSDIDGIEETAPVSFYGNDNGVKASAEEIKSSFVQQQRIIGFTLPAGYDSTRTLVIDPFVTATGNLTGLNAGKAKDVDFDYAGNIYVTGGGSGATHQLAKFNASGVLQWTFSGSMVIPSWTFGGYWGGWMVEKPTGNIYLGQGFNPATGFQVIRLSTTGLYDNFITNANPNFREAWKMYWSCNNGSPQILVAGGGTNSNINFGVFVPPSTAIGSLNVTGIPYTGANGWAQDIVDFVIDPSNNDMYTIYGSLIGHPSLSNKIYKNSFPYSGASVAWNVPSGFTAVQEIANRPYLAGGLIDNSANIFALNASYLFYWDGKNLKAFNKLTGAGVGTPLTTSNTLLMQGGIIADACNNIFVGDGNGFIKVYQFNGTTFDDAAAPDIVVPGFSGRSVYDLAYDESKKLLYASGDGFVGAFDVSSYCPATQYTLNIATNCVTATATATISPAPPAGSTITYVLHNGTVQLATNTTGIFSGLSPNITYTVNATVNLLCSGGQTTASFVLPGPTVNAAATHTTCGNSTGSITATATGTAGPYSYSIDGTNFQPAGLFTGLAAGVYIVTVKDAAGCSNTDTLTILNTNGPQLSYTATSAACGANNGTITASATGGTTPYQYTINGGAYQNGNFFTGLTGGTYTLTVKDANGCTNAATVNISSSLAPQLTAIPAAATCGSSNGTITAFGSSGTPPLQYSINGNIFQPGNVFNNITPGIYTVTVKDANGCMASTTVTVANSPAPSVTAFSTAAACNNVNGTITATGAGGIAPLQYSINGVSFQASNVFTGLAAGAYTITVKDATGCTNIINITVAATNAPSVTATSTVSSCNASTGTITAAATGGTPAYQYSINGVNFQVSNIFTALAAGNYVVYVRDAAGCIATTFVVVGNTAGPSISVAVTATACNTSSGSITITGTGGTAPLQYSIDGINYGAGNVFGGLAAGIYTAYVKDANGCIKTATVTVTNVSGLSATASSLSSSCSGSSGTITVTASGGVLPLQYSIDGTNYQAGNVFNGVAPGLYTVYVKDASGCIITRPVNVASVAGPSLTATVLHQATCGTASGVIAANGSGGVPPLTYSLNGGAYQAIRFFINVSPGVHTVTVKDANGCTAAQTVTITNSGAGTAPTDVTFTIRDALACTGQTGRIKNLKGVPSGGGNNYTFSLDGGAFTTANQFTNVPVGVHTITARNQNGCTVTRLAIIGSGVPATATATATATACNTTNGTITISGVGVNTSYHASIDNGATWITFAPPGANSFTFTGLAPGTYNIIMADDADFTAGPPDIPGTCLTTISVVVPSLGGPSVSATSTGSTCNTANGSITATGNGGTPPYTYSINGGTYFTSGVFNNLAPGVYAISVQDATGCTNGINVTLASQSTPAISTTLQAATCNQDNGSITVNATGGTAPLEYSINGTTFQSSNIFSSLAPGAYTVYVKDASGCYGTSAVTIAKIPVPAVTAFTIAATCNNSDGSIIVTGSSGTTPYTYSINGTLYQSSNTFSGLSSGFYTITIKDAAGCTNTTGISLPALGGPSVTVLATPATCGNANGTLTATGAGGTAPLSYSIDGTVFQPSGLFTGLASGTYTVYVKDATGCTNTRAVLLANTSGPQTLTATVVAASCGTANGTITATATGGVAPLQYSINGTTYQPGTLFSNLAAGAYTLYVKDANGCIKTLAVTVLHLGGPVPAVTSSPSSCGLSDGTITVTASGGTGALSYSINGTTFQSSNIFLSLPAGNYTVTVRDTKNCIGTATISVGSIGATVTPAFNAIAPICSGDVLSPLPLTSLNNISGTWSPALNNTATTTYTFTPNAGACAGTATLTIIVHPKPLPIIITHN